MPSRRQLHCYLAAPTPFPYSQSRQVTPQEGEELAQSHHAAWIETSAKTNKNVGTYPCPLMSHHQCAHASILPAEVFQLVLAEIEKSTPNNKTAEPQASRCCIM